MSGFYYLFRLLLFGLTGAVGADQRDHIGMRFHACGAVAAKLRQRQAMDAGRGHERAQRVISVARHCEEPKATKQSRLRFFWRWIASLRSQRRRY